jgi:Kef-type K+ transport system membrane component KefB
MSDPALAALLFVQLALILATCRGLGWIFTPVRQPLVVAEMVAGFLLGPSFFGWVAPSLQARLFAPESKHTLFVLSQIGLVLYMFSVGLEFRSDLVTRYRRRAFGVSAAGILAPFAVAAVLAMVLMRLGGFFADQVSPVHAVMFLGAAMSITAFPVLARIISERGIAGTTVGSLSLAAGAMGDAAAWMILAVVLSSFTGNALLALLAAGGALLFVVIVFFGVRRLLAPLASAAEQTDGVRTSSLVTVLCLLAVGAWFTDYIGIHSVFGAFVLGVSVPRGTLSRELRRMIEPLTKALFVPLFFVYSGLNTRLTLLDSAALWTVTAAVFAAACAAKGGACWLAARLGGAPPRHALAIGTLMNARGMVELILANIGLERGLITPTLFAILVLMAIGTTVMTGPLFSLVWEEKGSYPVLDTFRGNEGYDPFS